VQSVTLLGIALFGSRFQISVDDELGVSEIMTYVLWGFRS